MFSERYAFLEPSTKFRSAHFFNQNFVKGLPLLSYPDVCTESPQAGKAFCGEHVAYLAENHPDVPADVRGFLKYCGIQRTDTGNESDVSFEEIRDQEVSKVDDVLVSFHDDEISHLGNSVVQSQGNTEFTEKEHDAVNSILNDCIETEPTTCNKDTGGKQRLQKWSRGHLFIVRGGGIIDKWSPLFKSASPSQVFIVVLSWLCIILKQLSRALSWSKVFVAHDNMCHLDGLRAAKNLLPWPSPWDRAWISVKKIIDRLHISNHKDKRCKENYDPSTLKEEIPNANTVTAEQTFVWLSRFKKIQKCITCFTSTEW